MEKPMVDDAVPTRLGRGREARITVEGQDTDTASLWELAAARARAARPATDQRYPGFG